MREVVIVDSVRTGLAKSFRGKFNMTRPDDMAAHCVDALLVRHGIDPKLVDDCIVGAGSNEGAQGMNIGRNVAVLSRLGNPVAGMTLNRFCSSGLQAIAIAANQVASGCSDIIVAGGVESMSRAPYVMGKADSAFGRSQKIEDTTIGWRFINPKMKDMYGVDAMPQTADNVGDEWDISREDQDAFALRSQQRTAAAQQAGFFAEEIVPVVIKGRKGDTVVDTDEHPRADTTAEALARLKPVNEIGRAHV